MEENTFYHKNDWNWGTSVVITKHNGRGIVNVSITKAQPKVAFISGLSVEETSRRNGYGQEMLEAAETYASQAGCAQVELYADPDSFTLGWYKKNGYIPKECEHEGLARLYKRIDGEEGDFAPEFVAEDEVINTPTKAIILEGINPLERLRLLIYKAVNQYCGGIYSDNDWSHAKYLVGLIGEVPGVSNVIAGAGEYFNYLSGKSDPNRPAHRDIPIRVETAYGDLEGYIRCHAAGTVEDEFSAYDMTISLYKAKDNGKLALESARLTKGYGRLDESYKIKERMFESDKEFLLEIKKEYSHADIENYVNSLRRYGVPDKPTTMQLAFHSGTDGGMFRRDAESSMLPQGKKVVMRKRKNKDVSAEKAPADMHVTPKFDEDDFLVPFGPNAICNPKTGHWYDCYIPGKSRALQVMEYALKDGGQVRDDGWPTKEYVNEYIKGWMEMFSSKYVHFIEDDDYDPLELVEICDQMNRAEFRKRHIKV